MKKYIGTHQHQVTVVTTHPLEHHVRHSPTGFSWGYSGSGPSDLARSILIDIYGETPEVEKLYHDFCHQVIDGLIGDFELNEETIRQWVVLWRHREEVEK